MRRQLAIALLGLFTVSTAWAFDYSPTQTPSPKKATRRAPVQISPQLVQSVLADEALVKGTELLSVSDDGTSLDSMRGDLSAPLSGDLEKATRNYLITHASLFNVPSTRDPNCMKVIKAEKAAGADHFFYQMMVDGVAVHEAIVDLHVGKDRRIQLANGSFPTIKGISNQISIGRIEALAAAKRALGAKTVRGTPKAEMVVFPKDGKGVMAFLVKMASSNPMGDWEVLIDAETGKEISRLNQLSFVSGNTGKGAVYVNNPEVGPITEEPLLHLTKNTLYGEFANVLNEDTDEASNTADVHIYDPNDTHFDEVNIYFYINQIHDFFNRLGFNKLDAPMKATVHVGDKYDNAYFSPMENAMAFGDGNKLNDLAKEETVCYHEYSHAHINQIVKLNYSAESGAMNEGQADYFACSFTNDPKLGEYVMKKMGKPYLRHMENKKHYPEDITNEVHADGEIWGGVLWDIRAALGSKISDLIIEKSFSYLKPGSPKFSQGASAIILADKNNLNGANKDQLMEVFKKRGISVATLEGTDLSNTEIKRLQMFNTVHEK